MVMRRSRFTETSFGGGSNIVPIQASAQSLDVRSPGRSPSLTRAPTASIPLPVNVLIIKPTMTVADLASLGVRRISVGGALARAAWAGFMGAAKEIAEQGTFTAFAGAAKGAELNGMFAGK
jgi:2-methylisocitrate lyase-like PEP mutase family enzyme